MEKKYYGHDENGKRVEYILVASGEVSNRKPSFLSNEDDILTKERLKKIGEELADIINNKLPEIEKELGQLQFHIDIFPITTERMKEQRNFYKNRIEYLKNMIDEAKIVD